MRVRRGGSCGIDLHAGTRSLRGLAVASLIVGSVPRTGAVFHVLVLGGGARGHGCNGDRSSGCGSQEARARARVTRCVYL